MKCDLLWPAFNNFLSEISMQNYGGAILLAWRSSGAIGHIKETNFVNNTAGVSLFSSSSQFYWLRHIRWQFSQLKYGMPISDSAEPALYWDNKFVNIGNFLVVVFNNCAVTLQMKRHEKMITVNPMIGIIPEMIGDCGYDGLPRSARVRILERVYRFILKSRNQQLIKKMLAPSCLVQISRRNQDWIRLMV
jgi:hypothetical protein